MSERFTPPVTDVERFLFACLLLGAMTADYDYGGTDTYRTPEPPGTPYEGYPGQRPGESFTAYRQRVRKEQQT
jgi:hypothetical protein